MLKAKVDCKLQDRLEKKRQLLVADKKSLSFNSFFVHTEFVNTNPKTNWNVAIQSNFKVLG